MNVRSATKKFFAKSYASHIETDDNERLLFHDALHMLLDCPVTYRDEFIVAIYQAVLTDTLYVGLRQNTQEEDPEEVSAENIKTQVLPKIEGFLKHIERQYSIAVRRDKKLEEEDIPLHYKRARALSFLLSLEFGCAVKDLPVKEFLEADAERLKDFVYQARISVPDNRL